MTTHIEAPSAFSILNAIAMLKADEWMRLLKADGISVVERDIDATDRTITKNRLNKELKAFYSIKYNDPLDIELGGAVLCFEDGTIQFVFAKKDNITNKTQHFKSESGPIQHLLRDPRYLEQCDGDTTEILKSAIVHICLTGRR